MNDQSDQNRADGELDRGAEDTSPEIQQTSEQDEVLAQGENAGRPPKKSKMPPSRIAFLVFVLVAAVAIVVELRARRSYTRTVEALNQAFEKQDQEGTGLYRKDLEKLIHGSPSRQSDELARTETFTWRGIRTHHLQVQYGDLDFVSSYSTPQ
ncbi:MAG: hypothetical protein H8E44_17750 [Planctomycetes bacterium]|nr:hypothetical protein [Planctomycetota bacterium]MBL7038510.1 hypothetical protein [Pirellulaceae bacterium]